MRLVSFWSIGGVMLLLALCGGCIVGSSSESSSLAKGGSTFRSGGQPSGNIWSTSASSNLSRQLKPPKTKSKSFYDGVAAQFAKLTKAVTPQPKIIKAPQPTSLSSGVDRLSPEVLVSSAKIYEEAGDHVKAAEHYRNALAIDSKNLAALLGYGHLLDWKNDLVGATEQYRQATEHHPDSGRAHNDLGLCYARRGMLAESAQSLLLAIQLRPKKKLYHNNLAAVLVKMGQPQQALAHLMQAHGTAAAHYNLGYLLTTSGDMRGAEAHFSEALRADPSLTPARQWLERLGAKSPTATRVVPAERPFASRQPTATTSVPTPALTYSNRGRESSPGSTPAFLQPTIRIPVPSAAPSVSADAARAPTPDDFQTTSGAVEPLPPIAVGDDLPKRW